MVLSLFLSKNQKLVRTWRKEHQEVVFLANRVISEYTQHKPSRAKKYLIKLNHLAVNHLMSEDIEFYRLLKDKKRMTIQNKILVDEFTSTFKGTKLKVMHFLAKYSKEDVLLDENFFSNFKELVSLLVHRMEFEESNLYRLLYAKG